MDFFGSDPGFVSRITSRPGFVNPVRSDPIRSDPAFVNARSLSPLSFRDLETKHYFFLK